MGAHLLDARKTWFLPQQLEGALKQGLVLDFFKSLSLGAEAHEGWVVSPKVCQNCCVSGPLAHVWSQLAA